MGIQEEVNRVANERMQKKWNEETELALRCMKDKRLSLKDKMEMMADMFPNFLWSVPSIASKERRMK